MALQAKELRQKAGKIHTQMNEILTKSAEKMSAEDETKWDAFDSEYNSLMKQAEKLEAFEKREIEDSEENREVETKLKKGDLDPEKRKEYENLALKEFVLTGKVSKELHSFMSPAKGEKDDVSMIDSEYKRLGLVRAAQQSTTDGSGGYTIATGFQREIEKAMLAYGGMLEVSRLWRTAKGNVIEWPKINDTSNRAYLLSEAGNAETSAVKVTDAQQQFEAYKITSGLLRLSSEIIEDSEFNIAGEINSFLSERMGRGINYYTTLADGSSKPKGITIAAAHGNNTADDQALAYDDWVDLIHEIDPAYRVNSSFMFHDTVLKTLKKLKDSQNLPVWLPSMRDGEPSTLFGYRYTINQDMAEWTTPTTASNNDSKKIALFGNFKKYIIRTVNNMRLVRLNERFGDTDEIGLVAFWRIDGDLLDAGTHPVKYMRVSAT